MNRIDEMLEDEDFLNGMIFHSSTLTPAKNAAFEVLPFNDVVGLVVEPSALHSVGHNLQKTTFYFSFTPFQVGQVEFNRRLIRNHTIKYMTQVILRIGVLNASNKIQDTLPKHLKLKVNGKDWDNFDKNTKKTGPMDITKEIMPISSTLRDSVTLIWYPETSDEYYVSVCLVKKLACYQAVRRIKNKGYRPIKDSLDLIEKQFKGSDELGIVNLKISLKCPISQKRMLLPCRSATCNHFECFDLQPFIKMNEKKSTWFCPICKKPVKYEDLQLDGHFYNLLQDKRLINNDKDVLLNIDGSCTNQSLECVEPVEVIDLCN